MRTSAHNPALLPLSAFVRIGRIFQWAGQPLKMAPSCGGDLDPIQYMVP